MKKHFVIIKFLKDNIVVEGVVALAFILYIIPDFTIFSDVKFPVKLVSYIIFFGLLLYLIQIISKHINIKIANILSNIIVIYFTILFFTLVSFAVSIFIFDYPISYSELKTKLQITQSDPVRRGKTNSQDSVANKKPTTKINKKPKIIPHKPKSKDILVIVYANKPKQSYNIITDNKITFNDNIFKKEATLRSRKQPYKLYWVSTHDTIRYKSITLSYNSKDTIELW